MSTNVAPTNTPRESNNTIVAQELEYQPIGATISVQLKDGSRTVYPQPPLHTPRCQCGKTATVMRSWTGTNPGRLYYTCSTRLRAQQCNYFTWVPENMTEWYNSFPRDAFEPNFSHLFKEPPSIAMVQNLKVTPAKK